MKNEQLFESSSFSKGDPISFSLDFPEKTVTFKALDQIRNPVMFAYGLIWFSRGKAKL